MQQWHVLSGCCGGFERGYDCEAGCGYSSAATRRRGRERKKTGGKKRITTKITTTKTPEEFRFGLYPSYLKQCLRSC